MFFEFADWPLAASKSKIKAWFISLKVLKDTIHYDTSFSIFHSKWLLFFPFADSLTAATQSQIKVCATLVNVSKGLNLYNPLVLTLKGKWFFCHLSFFTCKQRLAYYTWRTLLPWRMSQDTYLITIPQS